MPPLLLKLVFDRIESAPLPFFVKPIARAIAGRTKNSFVEPQITRHLNYLEAALSKFRWFAGDKFTAADIQISFPLEAANKRMGLDASRLRLVDFLARIHARQAYERALARGGKYDLLD
jgi:glutathione S-transferase